ncbi:hypothetical protein P3T18_004363 [Paraburkholderia sp. GAS199]|uniref:DUF4148 domain-containing protein n=1 Tax=Paraburkholderia sp. GAS199 TaxID=3035126 RepID=UPI003D1ED767
MKRLALYALTTALTTALTAALVVRALPAFAQASNGPLSREQVLRDLCDLEGVGYRPAQASSLHFPDDIEAAEQRLASQKRQRASGDGSRSAPQLESKSHVPAACAALADPPSPR